MTVARYLESVRWHVKEDVLGLVCRDFVKYKGKSSGWSHPRKKEIREYYAILTHSVYSGGEGSIAYTKLKEVD